MSPPGYRPKSAAIAFATVAGACGFFTACAGAADGVLDPAYHGTGMLRTAVAENILSGQMVQQSDGKILLATVHPAGDDKLQVELYRLLPDGAPDAAFGTAGRVVTPLFGTAHNAYQAVALFPLEDGRILMAASEYNWAVTICSFARWNADGSPDESFAPGGMSNDRTRLAGGPAMFARQQDGRLIVATNPLALNGLTPDGYADPAFVRRQVTAAAHGGAMALQSDGKILLGEHSDHNFIVHRYHASGDRDFTFNFSGQASAFVPSYNGVLARCLRQMTDGSVLFAGTASSGINFGHYTALARYDSRGQHDVRFGGGGTSTAFFTHNGTDGLHSLFEDADGRILVVGRSDAYIGSWGGDLALARLHANGTMDESFGTGGKVRTNIAGANAAPLGAAMLPEDRLLLAAYRVPNTSEPGELVLLRYLLTGPMRVTAPGVAVIKTAPHSPPQDLGLVTVGSRSREFTIRNAHAAPLTGLGVSLTNESRPGEFLISQPGKTTLAKGEETSFVVTLLPPAGAAPGPRSADVHIAGSDPTASPFVITITGAKASGLQIWRITWFGDPASTGAGADAGDFDGDTIPNLIEYATGSHPHIPDPPLGTLTRNGDGTLAFFWRRAKATLTELTFQVETAATPAGPWNSAGVTDAILTDDGTVQTMRSTVPGNSAGGRQFVRLRVKGP